MGPKVPNGVAVAILGIVIGGVGGYYIRFFRETSHTADFAPAPEQAQTASGGGARAAGGPPSGRPAAGGGGGGGGQAMALPRLVRGLGLIQKAQGKGLTAQQLQSLLPILKSIQTADKLPAADAEAKLGAINKVLTDDQKKLLADMSPQRGGRGGQRPGGGAAGGPPSAPVGAPTGPPSTPMMAAPMAAAGGGGGGGGGPQMDPERPFASERNKQALDELVNLVGTPK